MEIIVSTLSSYQSKLDLDASVSKQDFIESGSEQVNREGNLFLDTTADNLRMLY